MSHLAMAALQLDLRAGDNADRLDDEIAAAKRRFPWLDLILLPELAVFGPGTGLAQPPLGPAEERFRRTARDNSIWLVPGSFYERDGEAVYNTAPVIDPAGRVIARARKLYPFCPYETGVSAGDEPVVFDIPKIGRVGISICYDMWFPETTRTLAWMGAEVVLHPSMTNTIDRDIERTIARASAAQNQCWFVDVNIAGDLGVGGSGVYGPGGEIVHEAGAGREIIALDLDIAHVRRVRERGWQGLGQVLKSFRDGPQTFAPYRAGARASSQFLGLGPLRTPGRQSAALEPSGRDADDHAARTISRGDGED